MSGSDLVVLFVYKNRRLEKGFQILSVGQMKVSVKGVWIYKKKACTWLVTEPRKIRTAQRIGTLLLYTPHLILPPQLGKEGHRATPQIQ